MDSTVDQDGLDLRPVSERLASLARVVGRFSSVGAVAALAVGVVDIVALVPWAARVGLPVGAALAVVLAVVFVGAPLRVWWHGRRVDAVLGDPGRARALLDAAAETAGDAHEALQRVAEPRGWGIRRVVTAWREFHVLRDLAESSVARRRVDELIAPLHPKAFGLTTQALWVSLFVLVLGLPLAVGSITALAVS
jgi:hypothetical protein